MTKIPEVKPKYAKSKKYMLIRYGRMDAIGFFEHHESRIPKLLTRVVVKTNRGLELGHLVGRFAPHKEGQFKLDKGQIKKYYDNSKIEFCDRPVGKVLRYATGEDVSEERHLAKIAQEEIQCCRGFVEEMELPMKIVDAEHIFGGERIIFYFMSESRVDFRDLVKRLAQEYQTRIEMRQIGARDEAKLLGDVESCGQPCCCKRFLKALKPVNMRMAKMQKATLDPAKISGYCGRLKCCLRYEDENYLCLKKRLPAKNTIVKTEQGKGRVLNSQILTQLVSIELEGGERVAIPVDEIQIIPAPAAGKRKPEPQKNRQGNAKNEAARRGNGAGKDNRRAAARNADSSQSTAVDSDNKQSDAKDEAGRRGNGAGKDNRPGDAENKDNSQGNVADKDNSQSNAKEEDSSQSNASDKDNSQINAADEDNRQ